MTRLSQLGAEVEAAYRSREGFTCPNIDQPTDLVEVALNLLCDYSLRDACIDQPLLYQLNLILSKGFGVIEN